MMLAAGALIFLDVGLIPRLLGHHVDLGSLLPLEGGNSAILLPTLAAFASVSAGGPRANRLSQFLVCVGAARAQLIGCLLTGLCLAAATNAMHAGEHGHSQPIAAVGYLVLAASTAWRIAEECVHAEVADLAHDARVWRAQRQRTRLLRSQATASARSGITRLATLAVLCSLTPFLLDLTVTAGTGAASGQLPVDLLADIGLNALVASFVLSALAVDVLTRIYKAPVMRIFFATLVAVVPAAVLINSFRLGGASELRTGVAMSYALSMIAPWAWLTIRWLRPTDDTDSRLPIRSLAIRMACAHATRVGKKRKKTRRAMKRMSQSS